MHAYSSKPGRLDNIITYARDQHHIKALKDVDLLEAVTIACAVQSDISSFESLSNVGEVILQSRCILA